MHAPDVVLVPKTAMRMGRIEAQKEEAKQTDKLARDCAKTHLNKLKTFIDTGGVEGGHRQ